MKEKKVFLNLSKQELKILFEEAQHPSYRIKQVFEWIYQKKVAVFDEMTNLPKSLIEWLNEEFVITSLVYQKNFTSTKDKGTQKFLLETRDKHFIECIVMPNSNKKYTLCVSSQIGCDMGCDFCATGKMGLTRSLDIEEVLGQYFITNQFLEVSNIVFMGMGEPFLNNDFFTILDRLVEPEYFGFKDRSITVSTVGIVEGIRKMVEYKQVGLALSYHSSVFETREVIFPILSLRHKWDELVDAILYYRLQTKKRITLEYTLMKGINDTQEEAKELLKLNKKLYFFLNIIPYNEHPLSPYEAPSHKDIQRFVSYLNDEIPLNVRYSKGGDIQAACGQLAYEKTKDAQDNLIEKE